MRDVRGKAVVTHWFCAYERSGVCARLRNLVCSACKLMQESFVLLRLNRRATV